MEYVPHLLGFARQASSQALNKSQNRFFKDLVEVYQKLHALEAELNTYRFSTGIEHQIIGSRLKQLAEQDEPGSLWGGIGRMEEPEDNPARIDTFYGYATVPFEGPPKSRLTFQHPLTGELRLGAKDQVEVIPALASNETETDPAFALTGAHREFYFRTQTGPQDGDMRLTYKVKLPAQLVAERSVNVITFHPYPVGITLEDVTAETYSTSMKVKGVPLGEQKGPWQIISPVEVTALSFTLRSTDWIPWGNRSIRCLGIRYLDAGLARFKPGTYSVDIRFPLPPGSKHIEQAVPVFLNEAALPTGSSLYSMTFKTYSGGSLEFETGSLPLISQGDELVVTVYMQASRDLLIAPQLAGVRLIYSL